MMFIQPFLLIAGNGRYEESQEAGEKTIKNYLNFVF